MEKLKRLFVNLANWQHFGLLVIVLASFILHLSVITNPPDQTIFDEVHYIEDGRRINTEFRSERNEHPPLARLIIAKSFLLIGDNAWGWRTVPVILSTLGLILFYGIARRLSKSNRLAFLATFLLAFENFYFIHGGMAMLDIYVLFFSILSFWLYLKGPLWWWASAIAGACAALSKFTGVLVFVTIFLHWLYAERETLRGAAKGLFKGIRQEAKVDEVATDASLDKPRLPYHRIFIFVFSMLLAPVAFLGLYALSEYFIWHKWIDLFSQLKTALTGTNSIKFSYDGAYPSRPWEWFLSPIAAFSIYQYIFTRGAVEIKLLGYDWPPYGPHITGITSLTTWAVTLFTLPWVIIRAMKRHLGTILLVVWFVGVGAVPALAMPRMELLPATVISMAWFVLIIPLVFFMKRDTLKDNTSMFILFWLVGSWAVWIPLAILTDRITYSFYYLPSVPALCLAAALLFDRLLSSAEKRHNKEFRSFIKGSIALFIFFHLAVFCLLSPVKLSISIAASILVLAFTLDYLEYSWQTTASAVIAVTFGILGLRYILYSYLEKWFGTDTIIGLYPARLEFWATGAGVTLAMIGVVFTILRKYVLRTSPEAPPPAV
jgi:hypothetical protein